MSMLNQRFAVAINGSVVRYTLAKVDAPKSYDGFGTITLMELWKRISGRSE